MFALFLDKLYILRYYAICSMLSACRWGRMWYISPAGMRISFSTRKPCTVHMGVLRTVGFVQAVIALLTKILSSFSFAGFPCLWLAIRVLLVPFQHLLHLPKIQRLVLLLQHWQYSWHIIRWLSTNAWPSYDALQAFSQCIFKNLVDRSCRFIHRGYGYSNFSGVYSIPFQKIPYFQRRDHSFTHMIIFFIVQYYYLVFRELWNTCI